MILNDGQEIVENMKKKGEIVRRGHEMVSVIITKWRTDICKIKIMIVKNTN